MKSIKKVYPNGDIIYENEHGYLHREDGPAVIYSDGDEEYWLNNCIYSYTEWLELIPNPLVYMWRKKVGNNDNN